MRTKGTVTYYENYNGTGIVRDAATGEFYFLAQEEAIRSEIILYEGLEISFKQRIKDYEMFAAEAEIAKKFKTGIITNIVPDDKGYISDRHGNCFWFKPSE